MSTLALQRCLRHLEREAVARCTRCREFFCRECITEHEEAVICAVCLAQLPSATARRGGFGRWPLRAAGLAAGLLLTLLFFYSFGKVLVLVPSSFHEGTLWSKMQPERSE